MLYRTLWSQIKTVNSEQTKNDHFQNIMYENTITIHYATYILKYIWISTFNTWCSSKLSLKFMHLMHASCQYLIVYTVCEMCAEHLQICRKIFLYTEQRVNNWFAQLYYLSLCVHCTREQCGMDLSLLHESVAALTAWINSLYSCAFVCLFAESCSRINTFRRRVCTRANHFPKQMLSKFLSFAELLLLISHEFRHIAF